MSESWVPVSGGQSGASVFRSADGARFAKRVPAGRVAELAGERDRLLWLGDRSPLAPRFVDWRQDDSEAWLITGAVAGVTADRLSVAGLRRAWGGIASAVRTLHDIPAGECPFRNDLAWMVAVARDVVARGAVNPDFLPVEQRGTPGPELFERVLTQLPRRLEQESTDMVVCHGDLCLPNVVVDPETFLVTGLVDLGRLGLADRHADLSLLLGNARGTWPDETTAEAADDALKAAYGTPVDDARLTFYLHLDPLTWG